MSGPGTPGAAPRDPTTPAELFAGDPVGHSVLGAVAAVVAGLGPHEVRVSRSQVAFRRRRGFAYVWRPGRYVRSDVPAVLSLAAPERWESARFKEVAHPAPRTWMHHLELAGPEAVDEDVRAWLRRAYEAAG